VLRVPSMESTSDPRQCDARLVLSGGGFADIEIDHWVRERRASVVLIHNAYPLNPMSALSLRSPIGPFAHPDEENRHPFFRVVRRYNWRARQIGSPAFLRVPRNKKHQMGMPAHFAVA
jgi:hypothetical protein